MPATTRSMSKILHQQGYIVYRNVLSGLNNAEILELLRDHMNETSDPIFNNIKTNDNRRRQSKMNIKNPQLKQWTHNLEETLRSIHPLQNLSFRDWNVLQSLPGCKMQQAHTDYVPTDDFIKKMAKLDNLDNQSKIPLLCLVAL